MSVGGQIGYGAIDSAITNLSVGLRNLTQQIANLSLYINGQGTGLATLETLGYDSTDAAAALTAISYLNTVAQIYYGNLQQGGTGGTGATAFNFNQELSQYWAGQ